MLESSFTSSNEWKRYRIQRTNVSFRVKRTRYRPLQSSSSKYRGTILIEATIVSPTTVYYFLPFIIYESKRKILSIRSGKKLSFIDTVVLRSVNVTIRIVRDDRNNGEKRNRRFSRNSLKKKKNHTSRKNHAEIIRVKQCLHLYEIRFVFVELGRGRNLFQKICSIRWKLYNGAPFIPRSFIH